ncbi:MAG: hypothetical protein JJU06_13625 [Ectothiorhodospiraceae bacterium]|nr:hypothetical protein [Ectothiorhodospiraceae bacterium]MCH8505200.1 hypothetical protein [Ectothiorhodospiraceae bacterium]
MTLYHCTVEVREKSGRMHQYSSDIEAEDGDAAAKRAEAQVAEELRTHPDEEHIEEIVCRVADHH